MNFVLLEFGSMACTKPYIWCETSSYVADKYPNIFKRAKFKVKCVTINLIFWEKLVILYRETQRPMNKMLPSRISRHFYDLYCILKSVDVKRLISSKYLLLDIAKNDLLFYYRAWENIGNILKGTFSVVPNNEQLKRLKEDYELMHPMFFKKEPTFDEIIHIIKKYEPILLK